MTIDSRDGTKVERDGNSDHGDGCGAQADDALASSLKGASMSVTACKLVPVELFTAAGRGRCR
ncbi:MAG: hypothetical protein ACLU7D_04485 [Collinsella sp.]